ncbi:PREDICTED: galactoside 2-alpha-L-fucosyltransferase 2-like [Nanorana parkeri]|uniref:galactoside 2-alpha-L-fucosyltransferase 2-like n=1 Tax=Nanorana parkeri TaxID=125878 RepID=UPI00085479FB|nr:PREDICTED: galactoside 2-alpha-L-fucosyltransferase 2-like [Nanorana parkeri]
MTTRIMNKHLFYSIGVIFILLVIMTLSYLYYAKLDFTDFRNFGQKKGKFISRTEGSVTNKSQAIEEPKPLTGMWTVNAIGRLGNLMGEYATLYSLAKMNGRQAYILPGMHSQLAKIFKIRLPALHQEVSNRIKWRNYGLHDWMSEEYRHIEGEYVQLRGTPCSFTFYHHIKDEILREFTFHDFIKEESYAYLNNARGDKKNVTFVGIHVRRGDYVHVMPNTWKGVIADKGYLQKAMDYFRNKYESPLFIVTSNGMDWCKENMNNSKGDIHFAGDGQEGSPGRDFALLAHCNHTIMSVGTFGIWVGYLVGGETIYLTNYTLPDSPFLKLFKYEAAFLPEWIGIPADLSPLLNNKNP